MRVGLFRRRACSVWAVLPLCMARHRSRGRARGERSQRPEPKLRSWAIPAGCRPSARTAFFHVDPVRCAQMKQGATLSSV